MHVSTQLNPSLNLIHPQMSASEFFDAIPCTSPLNNLVIPILAIFRSPRANPEKDDSHLTRALKFVSQLEPECRIEDFNAPNIDWDSQTCSVAAGFDRFLIDTFDSLLLHQDILESTIAS